MDWIHIVIEMFIISKEDLLADNLGNELFW